MHPSGAVGRRVEQRVRQRRTSALNTVNAFDLASGVVVVRRAEDQRRAERLVQTRPDSEGARRSSAARRRTTKIRRGGCR